MQCSVKTGNLISSSKEILFALLQEDGLPADVIERLVRRPEDLPTHVEDNIMTYKSNVLRILEVILNVTFNYSELN